MRMKQLNTFDEALQYVNRLGFASRGKPIAWAQSDLCDVVKAIEKAAGVKEGKLDNYPYYDQPIQVRFHMHKQGSFSYPWLGSFTVIGPTGEQTVDCREIQR